jgi:hypothetical protein
MKCCIWSIALYGAETWTVWIEDRKSLESFGSWYWIRQEKISWTDRVKNEDVLRRVKEEKNIIYAIKRRTANWIGHIQRRNCLKKLY